MITNATHLAEINSPKQQIKASVELYNGSTLITECTCADVLSDFTVERVGEGKFFGFGIVHSLKVTLIDINRTLTINSSYTIRVSFTVGDSKVYPYPTFYIKPDGIERDETANTITITAYDYLGKAAEHTFSELNLTPPYTYAQVATACRSLLGIGTISTTGTIFNTSFAEGANFEGTETIREVLNAIAEATQTIYHIKAYGVSGTLRFKQIVSTATTNLAIEKESYFSLKANNSIFLNKICHATELGDNVISSASTTAGVTQYVRNNPFWETIAMSGDIGATVDAAATKMKNTYLTPFESEWAGNYLLEPLDKVTFAAEDGSLIRAFIIDDVIHYDGTLTETTRWQYDENDAETESNPSNLGEALKQTFARVDKVNKEIELVVSDTTENTEAIAQIKLDLNGINLTLKEQEEAIESLEGFDTAELENTVKTHTEKISGIEIDLGSVKTTVSEQETKITTLEGTAEEISAAVGENGEKISGLETDNETLKKTTTEHTTKIGTLETTLDSINATVSAQGDKITTLETDTGALKSTTEEHTTQIGNLQITTQNITASVSSQESKITTLQGTTEEINASIADLEGEADTLRGDIEGLETETGNLKLTTTQNTEKIGTLETTLDGINATVSNQGEKITTLESDTGELKSTTEEHTSQIAALQISTNSITASVSSQEEKITTLQGTTGEISNALAENGEKITALEGTTGELGEAIAENGEKIGGLETDTNNLKLTTSQNTEKIGTLETTLDGITARVSSQETKVTTLEGTAADINEAVTESNEKITALEGTTEELDAAITESNGKIGTLETDTESLKLTTSENTTKIGTLETTLDGINASVSEQNTKITTLETDTGELKGITETHTSQIGALQINTNSITASVSTVEKTTSEALDGLNNELTELSKEVSLKMSADDVAIKIQSALDDGVSKVKTETGFTFNDEGLTVSKSNSEISTQITEDGMTITREGQEVLVADNEGVKAEDLHATTFLIIGNNSRLEDWGERTACFWIGG